jgi:hypothetical protein
MVRLFRLFVALGVRALKPWAERRGPGSGKWNPRLSADLDFLEELERVVGLDLLQALLQDLEEGR